MNRVLVGKSLLALMLAGFAGAVWATDSLTATQHDPLPLVFEQNAGQLDGGVDFLARGKGFAISLSRGAATLHPTGETGLIDEPLKMELVGSNEGPIGSGMEQLPGGVNYIKGNDPSQWRIGAPLYERVGYTDVYPGIDVVYYPNGGDLEYDFVLAPGADPDDIRIRFSGSDSVSLSEGGALSLVVEGGVMLQHAPVSFQHINGLRVPVESRYQLRADGSLGFSLGGYDSAHPLTIDPVLTYASLFPGSAFDAGAGVAVPSFGGNQPSFFTCGSTEGLTFSPGTTFGGGGDRDIYVAKINPFATGTGTLVWLTIIGGSGLDTASDILHYQATDGYLFVSGTTTSTNLPVVDGPDAILNDGINTTDSDGVLFALKDSGDVLESLTYVGGGLSDNAAAIINNNNVIYLTGETTSTDLPIVGSAFQGSLNPAATIDTFVAKYNFSGLSLFSLVYSSYLNSENARPLDIALASFDQPVIVGQTGTGLSTKAAFQTVFNNGSGTQLDAFVCQWNLSAPIASDTLLFNSYLGGSGLDIAFGVTTIGGISYVVGRTSSNDFPNNFGQALSGPQDGFIARVSQGIPNAALSWTALYGGPGTDLLREVVAIGASGLYVAGATNSTSGIVLPSPQFDPISGVLNGGDNTSSTDIWLMRFPDVTSTPPPSRDFASYLGGKGSDSPSAIAIDAQQRVYLSGQTASEDFPLSNAFATKYSGAQEGFVAVIREAVFVDAASTVVGLCGDSWGQACPTINEGIQTAGTNGEVWVKAGSYAEFDINPLSGLQLYGGFGGDEAVRDDRDLSTNVTTFAPPVGDSILFPNSQNRIDGFQFIGSQGNNGALAISAKNNVTVANCYFYKNQAVEDGGGIYIDGGSSSIRILNCIFTDNQGERGGAIAIFDSSVVIANCTFAANTAAVDLSSNAIYFEASFASLDIVNSIIWGIGDGTPQVSFGVNVPVVSNSLVETGFAGGTDILDTDPLFVEAPVPAGTAGDVNLKSGSPARNFGIETTSEQYGFIYDDIIGNPRRVIGTTCKYDLGAVESELDPPVISLTGASTITLEANEAYTELGATADDGCGNDINGLIVIDASAVNITAVGNYIVTYDVTNAQGIAAAQVTRQVQVVDTTPPVIVLTGGDTVIECGSTYVDPGFSATDNVDGVITGSVTVTNPIDSANVGPYVVRYNVSDAEGNAAIEVTRTVNVVDSLNPAIVLLGANPITVACGGTYVEPGFTAVDTCAGTLTADVNATNNIVTTTPGNYQVTYQVQDPEGNTQTATRTVRVEDNKAPIITLTGPTTEIIECGGTYTDQGATAADDCDGDLSGSIVRFGVSGVNTLVPGDYLITYNVQDNVGNAADEVTRVVTVQDSTPPVITLLGDATVQVQCGGIFSDPGATVLDACEGTITPVSSDTVNTNAVGTYVINYNADDLAGNSAVTVQRTVQVVDTTAPAITLLGANPLTVSCGTAFVEPGYTASDSCDGNLNASVVVGGDTVDATTSPGTYTIEYSVTDAVGLGSGVVTRQVIVEDVAAPVITLLGANPLTVSCGGTYLDPGATALDTCDGTVAVTIGGDTVDPSTPGDYTVSYSAEDAEGNVATVVTRLVTVEDNGNPAITLSGPATVVLECGDAFVEPGFDAQDACDGDLNGAVVTTTDVVTKGGVTELPVGNYVVLYEVTDASGNIGNAVRNLEIVDTTPPVITLTGAETINLSCGDAYSEPGATALDACEGIVTVTISGDTVNEAVPGSYVITYNASDAEGNNADPVTRTVNVLDNSEPVINLVGESTVLLECGATYTEAGATASDDCSLDLTSSIVVSGDTVNPAVPGTYSIAYSVEDADGNASQISRTVEVLDTTAPVVTLVGPTVQSVQCGNAFVDQGATASDTCDGDLSGSINVELAKPVDVNALGTYNIRYFVEDAEGNRGEAIRTVNVVDSAAPVITIIGPTSQTVECRAVYNDPGATALDTCDGDLSGDIVATGTVNTNVPGVYTLRYNVQDGTGNPATQRTRTVTVQDNVAPVISRIGDASISIDCGVGFDDPGATALDECAGNLTASIIRTGLVNADAPGTYNLVYNVTDPAGNTAAAVTRTVVVRDNCAGDGEPEGEGDAEGAVEGEGAVDGEGSDEGEVEGAGEGEGDDEGEGEVPVACDAPCGDATNIDNDGDGLNTCEEAFFGTSDDDTDSDGDGMPDNYEARYCPFLNPTDPSDASENPDGDSFDNLNEFLRRGDPLDAQSPSRSVYVAPASAGGRDEPSRGGSSAEPWATIRFALTQIDSSPEAPVNIILAEGTYVESFAMKPGVSIFPRRGAQPVIVGTIAGAEGCALVDLIIAPRTGPTILLTVNEAAMRVERCLFRGPSRRDSTGILILGARAREVEIDGCVFERLAIGIDVDAGHPALRRSFFENLSAVGIIIRCPEGTARFSQFDGDDARVGFNTFSPDLSVPAVINECPVPANMERNDWGVEGIPTPDTIDGVIEGAVNFDNFLQLGGALIAGSIFCTVWDAADQEPILNARIALQPVFASNVTNNIQGVYVFPAINSGNYVLSVTAPGYDPKSQAVQLADGELASVILALNFNGEIEEGEGEDPPPTGGCPCNQNNKLGPPQPGDLVLSLLTFAALALSTVVLRRQSRQAIV